MIISKQAPSVAVLVLNYQQWDMTIECLKSILNSDYANFKIFIADNGPESIIGYNSLKEYESDKCLVLMLEKNIGYVKGMNYLLDISSKAGYEYFLIMNNDTIIHSNAISMLVNTSIANNNNCIVTGKVYHYDRPEILQYIGLEFVNKKFLSFRRLVKDEIDMGQWDKEMEMDMIDDIFWLIPSKVYKMVGGYTTYFWFNAEQADLALRAVKKGFKLIYTPNAKIWHKGSLSIGGRCDNPKLTFYDVQTNLIFKYTHLPIFRFLFYYIHFLFIIMKGYIKYFIKFLLNRKRNRNIIDAKLKAIFWFNSWVINKNENDGITPFD